MNIVFFGSFQHYSVHILESLIERSTHESPLHVVGVVTTPPMPVGRKQIITKTPVHLLAEQYNIPVFTPEKLGQPQGVAPTKPDFFITAGYGKILTKEWLDYPTQGALNLHFSLLPSYRGANPAEWAIMCGETKTGITLMKMNEDLDTGDIIAQSEIPITDTDTRETIYEKLYRLGAKELPDWLYNIERVTTGGYPYATQPIKSPTPYAALLKREDGFIPWKIIQNSLRGLSLQVEDLPSKHLKVAFKNDQKFLSRLPRALAGYPSLWTIVATTKGDKRMKIVSFNQVPGTNHPSLQIVQIEGQQPTLFNQIKNQITK